MNSRSSFEVGSRIVGKIDAYNQSSPDNIYKRSISENKAENMYQPSAFFNKPPKNHNNHNTHPVSENQQSDLDHKISFDFDKDQVNPF